MQQQRMSKEHIVTSEPSPGESRDFGREERSLMRFELDEVLSLLSVALHALKSEHEFQVTQVRPSNLPCLESVIKTISVGTSKLESCYLDLQLPGDMEWERRV